MQVNCWAGLSKLSVLMRCSHFGGTSQLILANKVRFLWPFISICQPKLICLTISVGMIIKDCKYTNFRGEVLVFFLEPRLNKLPNISSFMLVHLLCSSELINPGGLLLTSTADDQISINILWNAFRTKCWEFSFCYIQNYLSIKGNLKIINY